MSTKFREPDIRANRLLVLNKLTINPEAVLYVNAPSATKFEIEPVGDSTASYRYGINIDSDLFYIGGAAVKHYMVNLTGDMETASTGDSNAAFLKIGGSNYAANDSNFIFRGINVGITNRSGGEMGRLESSVGVQNKSGGIVPTLIALTATTENYGTNATEMFGIDVIARDEVGAGTTRAVARFRNDDRTGVAALDAGLIIESHSSSGGMDTLIRAHGAVLTEYDSGTKVCLMSFQGANGTTYYLLHDTDAPTVLSVSTSLA